MEEGDDRLAVVELDPARQVLHAGADGEHARGDLGADGAGDAEALDRAREERGRLHVQRAQELLHAPEVHDMARGGVEDDGGINEGVDAGATGFR